MNEVNTVGPVLIAGELSNHLIAAIKKLNPQVEVTRQGAYVRVLVAEQCRLTRQAVEEQTGQSFTFPESLELLMPSFKGKLTCSTEEVVWSFTVKS